MGDVAVSVDDEAVFECDGFFDEGEWKDELWCTSPTITKAILVVNFTVIAIGMAVLFWVLCVFVRERVHLANSQPVPTMIQVCAAIMAVSAAIPFSFRASLLSCQARWWLSNIPTSAILALHEAKLDTLDKVRIEGDRMG
mmetsp:Transcript_82122/g.232525  ORF Transcript_82122/g.232525 Transcript_82122/m.232525 type:complete len:140 (+) Transcript_82122:215-634(+)